MAEEDEPIEEEEEAEACWVGELAEVAAVECGDPSAVGRAKLRMGSLSGARGAGRLLSQ